MEDVITFNAPKEKSSIIKVVGVGGGGSNAVNHMYKQGIEGVDFIVCNTDMQALEMSPVPNKVHLGKKGLGAGSIPAVGEQAAIDRTEEIKDLLKTNTEMLFITAGMGGGTGTGAAPIIAKIAKEVDLPDDDVQKILTVAIVTIPFSFEGRKRKMQAVEGIKELKKHCDAVLIISNDKLRELYGDLPLSNAFAKADNILLTAAKGIAEIITVKAYVNIDFKDVNTVMKSSGVAIMGTGTAGGEDRARQAIEIALTSPLLNDNNISGTSNILLYLSSGTKEISMDEITEITEFIIQEAGSDVEIIWGVGKDAALEEQICVTVVATGFDQTEIDEESRRQKMKLYDLHGGMTSVKEAPEIEEPKEPVNQENIELITKGKKTLEKPAVLETRAGIERTVDLSPEVKPEDKIEVKSKASKSTTVGQLFKDKDMTPPRFSTTTSKSGSKKISEPGTQEAKAQERIQYLKDLSIKLKTQSGLNELENEPAFVRRNVKLSDSNPSSEKIISRYSLSENDENQTELKSDNTYLHDNVD